MLDLGGHIVFANDAALDFCKARSSNVVGSVWIDLWEPSLADMWSELVDGAVKGTSGELGFAHRPGEQEAGWWNASVSPVLTEEQAIGGVLVSIRDLTEYLTALNRAKTAATTDALTGLPNRALFVETLEGCISDAIADGTKVGVVLFDLDHFKEINDDLGHDVGDSLLNAVAQRLAKLPEPVRIAARLGGDEFVLILTGLSASAEAEKIIGQLSKQLHVPLEYQGRQLVSKASFGLCLAPDHGSTCRELLKGADLALYLAKDLGRGGYAVYDPLMQNAVRHRNQVAERVRQSLDQDIGAHYQPKVLLDTGALDGFEALLRIRHPSGVMEGPGVIAPAFENDDLSCRISERMLEVVVEDMRRWLDAGIEFGRIAVNAAAPELRRPDFARELLQRLQNANVPAHMLEVEVVEGVFLGRGANVVEDNLRLFQEEGVAIALDDFGTGYASLAHIRNYAVDSLKVDMSFVQGIGDPKDEAIIASIASLGGSLGLKVVAEGIETARQARFLHDLGCPVGQGFLFSPPLEARQVVPYLCERDTRVFPWMQRGFIGPHPERIQEIQ